MLICRNRTKLNYNINANQNQNSVVKRDSNPGTCFNLEAVQDPEIVKNLSDIICWNMICAKKQ